MYKHLKVVVALGVVTAAFAAPSLAQDSKRSKVGQLSCDISDGMGRIIGSKEPVNCMFTPSRPGRRENYTALITQFHGNPGVTEGNRIVWTVYAPVERPFGALAGGYRRASDEVTATVGTGSSGNVLVGASRRGIILQPISAPQQAEPVSGVTGLQLRQGW